MPTFAWQCDTVSPIFTDTGVEIPQVCRNVATLWLEFSPIPAPHLTRSRHYCAEHAARILGYQGLRFYRYADAHVGPWNTRVLPSSDPLVLVRSLEHTHLNL